MPASDDDSDIATSTHSDNGASSLPLERKLEHAPEDLASSEDEKLGNQDLSDIESDIEPDELISLYLRTKARLYEISPTVYRSPSKKRGHNPTQNSSTPTHRASKLEERLRQRLQKIESDVLFDRQEAEAQWVAKKILLDKFAAQEKKGSLQGGSHSGGGKSSDPPLAKANGDPPGDHTTIGVEDSDDDDILGGIFQALPEVSNGSRDIRTADGVEAVRIRDFGRVTGVLPRRVLEEACRSRDPRCKIAYRQVSSTTYACRHSVTIDWSKPQDISERAFMKAVVVKSKRRHLTVTTIADATPDATQSESYVATAALFLIFSDSPKEEKAHLRLPPAFRDLWDEFAGSKRDHQDTADREVLKELRLAIDKQKAEIDGSEDDEVVFNASSRRLNGFSTGTSTPVSRPRTPVVSDVNCSQSVKDLWTRKISTPAHTHMLSARLALPIFNCKDAILDTIDKSQVTVLVGETGSGKSTQVPQFILEHELSQGRQCKIYCTEPRRISAISLAQRVSQELGESRGELGSSRSLVGYAIRLESKAVLQTKLVYATVGIVLRMLENLDGLSDVSHLILDEVHERSIDTDFLLIVLRSLMVQRPDLKIVLMSATVDAQKFSRYLDNAPIITVPGRTFPVKQLFLEDAIEITGHKTEGAISEDHERDEDQTEGEDQAASESSKYLTNYSQTTRSTLANYNEYAIDHALIVKLLEIVAYRPDYNEFSRAILIFVPGIQEIRQLHSMLVGHPSFSKGWRIYPLHSTFSSEEQQAAFEIPPQGIRKIVIATNIAETGITIPDITCVLDTGKHREMRFDERRQMSRLTQSFIARSNAKQRCGRAGRVQEGIAFSLFTRYRYDNLMAEQQTPEMLRLSLQDLVMRVKICKLGGVEEVLSQALDPPSSKNVRRAIDALVEVEALTSNEQLTALGRQIAKLPLDAPLGKMLIFGVCFGCLDFALTAAAALTSKSPFLSPLYARKQADTVRLGFKRGDSDILTVYNAYRAWRNVCQTRGMSEYHFANKNFLSPQNLANIEDLKRQLTVSLLDAGFLSREGDDATAFAGIRSGYGQRSFVSIPERYCTADENDDLISAVLAWSFYPKIMKRDGKGWRNIANNQSLGLHPTSMNRVNLSSDVRYLSFYSIMQGSSKFTNAQETTAISDFALVLLSGDAVFHMYAGVIVIDGNKLRFKVRDWKTMIVLQKMRAKFKEGLAKQLQHPGKQLGDRHRRWMEILSRIFETRNA